MLKMLEQIGDLDVLQECRCKLDYFHERNLLLGIRILNKTSHWLLAFTQAYYFQGPVFWTGAKFVDAPDEISLDVLRQIYPNRSDERIKEISTDFPPACMVQVPIEPVLIGYGGVNLSRQSFP